MKRDGFSEAIMKDLREAGIFEADPMPQKVPPTIRPATPAKQPAIKPLAQPQPKPASVPDAEPQEPAPNDQIPKVQSLIYTIKLRMSKLAVKTLIKKFLISYQDFDNNVTKNKKDMNTVRSYVAPIKGDVEALRGALEALEVELSKLDKMIGED